MTIWQLAYCMVTIRKSAYYMVCIAVYCFIVILFTTQMCCGSSAKLGETREVVPLQLGELTAEVENARHTSDMFDKEVVRAVEDFERIKRLEMKAQMGGLADAHVAFYKEIEDI